MTKKSYSGKKFHGGRETCKICFQSSSEPIIREYSDHLSKLKMPKGGGDVDYLISKANDRFVKDYKKVNPTEPSEIFLKIVDFSILETLF